MPHVSGASFAGSNISRVTGTVSRNTVVSNTRRTEAAILLLSEQLSSGVRLLRPSIDPIGTNLALDLQNRASRSTQFVRNADDSLAHLSLAESSIATVADLLDRAHVIALQHLNDPGANPDTFRVAAAEVDQLLREAVTIANGTFQGKFLFGGTRTTSDPFSLRGSSVNYAGDEGENLIAVSDVIREAQSLSGSAAFGAVSVEMRGLADLDPDLTPETKLSALNGGAGVSPGQFRIGDGVTSVQVDLRQAEDVADAIARINTDLAAAGLDISIAINGPPNVPSDADRFVLTRTGGGPIEVVDLAGGRTAGDLGILTPGVVVVPPAPTGFVGTDVNPRVTGRTTLASLLPGGVPLDLSGITIVNSPDVPPPAPTAISFAGLTTVEDLLFRINGSGTSVTARINEAGTAIDLRSTLSGARMVVGENGGTTAAQMGILYDFSRAELADLNGGIGVPLIPGGPEFQIAFTAGGPSFDIDISRVRTVAELEPLIESLTGGAIDVTINTALDSIELTGAGAFAGVPFTVTNLNLSFTATELGIESTAPAVTVLGAPRTFVGTQVASPFTALIRLRDALKAEDSSRLRTAANLVDRARQAILDVRGEVGGRARRLETLKSRLDDEKQQTEILLTQVKGVDFAEAASRFQLEQTILQAGLQAAARILNVSLLDFLG